jgi:aminobenzoyl-glutamate transport protein
MFQEKRGDVNGGEKNKTGELTGFYGLVEKVGNKIPNPVFMFMGLFVITFFASIILAKMGVSAIHPSTGKVIKVVSLLDSNKLLLC